MNQTIIYDYLGIENDPFYQEIKRLKKGQKIVLDGLTISLNYAGIYEVSSINSHDGFSSIDSCYKFLRNMLSEDNYARAL